MESPKINSSMETVPSREPKASMELKYSLNVSGVAVVQIMLMKHRCTRTHTATHVAYTPPVITRNHGETQSHRPMRSNSGYVNAFTPFISTRKYSYRRPASSALISGTLESLRLHTATAGPQGLRQRPQKQNMRSEDDGREAPTPRALPLNSIRVREGTEGETEGETERGTERRRERRREGNGREGAVGQS